MYQIFKKYSKHDIFTINFEYYFLDNDNFLKMSSTLILTVIIFYFINIKNIAVIPHCNYVVIGNINPTLPF